MKKEAVTPVCIIHVLAEQRGLWSNGRGQLGISSCWLALTWLLRAARWRKTLKSCCRICWDRNWILMIVLHMKTLGLLLMSLSQLKKHIPQSERHLQPPELMKPFKTLYKNSTIIVIKLKIPKPFFRWLFGFWTYNCTTITGLYT